MDENESIINQFQNNYPVMICCNGNGGFAEYFQYQSDWLDYYIKWGVNVFVWNYRGYGLSKGTPSPQVSSLLLISSLENKGGLRVCGLFCENEAVLPRGEVGGARAVDGRDGGGSLGQKGAGGLLDGGQNILLLGERPK